MLSNIYGMHTVKIVLCSAINSTTDIAPGWTSICVEKTNALKTRSAVSFPRKSVEMWVLAITSAAASHVQLDKTRLLPSVTITTYVPNSRFQGSLIDKQRNLSRPSTFSPQHQMLPSRNLSSSTHWGWEVRYTTRLFGALLVLSPSMLRLKSMWSLVRMLTSPSGPSFSSVQFNTSTAELIPISRSYSLTFKESTRPPSKSLSKAGFNKKNTLKDFFHASNSQQR